MAEQFFPNPWGEHPAEYRTSQRFWRVPACPNLTIQLKISASTQNGGPSLRRPYGRQVLRGLRDLTDPSLSYGTTIRFELPWQLLLLQLPFRPDVAGCTAVPVDVRMAIWAVLQLTVPGMVR